MKTTTISTAKEIKDYGLTRLSEISEDSIYGCDLHNEIYNMDYFVVGTYEAKKYLDDYGTFDAIHEIQEYENDVFGEVNTDLSDPEKVCNMLAYIIGEDFLNESKTLHENWDNLLDQETIDKIHKELEELI